MKFVGKQLWKGIKALAFKAIDFFKALFKLGGKFVNKIGTWIGRLGRSIKDKTYRFLIKPMASIMVTVFNFVTGVVMSPIHFIKWFVPMIFDKIATTLSNIYHGVKRVLRSTWSIFKKIFFNPLTIGLLIGGLLFFCVPTFRKWLTGGFIALKNGVVGTIVTFAKTAWGFLKGLASVLWGVGKFLFKVVEWVTNPEG